MKLKDIIVLISCVFVNLMFLAIAFYKTGGISRDDWGAISDISTSLSLAVALAAVTVAYITFNNQSKTNEESRNLVLLSQLNSELTEIKRSLDTSYISNGEVKNVGLEAVFFFMSHYRSNQQSMINSKDGPTYLYISQLLSQLNQLAKLAGDVKVLPFTGPYSTIAKRNVSAGIDAFLVNYAQIFDYVKDGLMGRQVSEYDFDKGYLRSHLNVVEVYDKLLQELEKLCYLSILQTTEISGSKYAEVLRADQHQLQARINAIQKIYYRINRD